MNSFASAMAKAGLIPESRARRIDSQPQRFKCRGCGEKKNILPDRYCGPCEHLKKSLEKRL